MKRAVAVLLIAFMLILGGCGGNGGNNGNKAITDIEEIEKIVTEFYSVLDEMDSYKLSTYYNDELTSVLTKDQDKMHMEVVDEEYGYDYYLFMEDGRKFVVSDVGSLYESEFEYDYVADTVNMMLEYVVFSYLGAEFEGTTYTAEPKGENELVFHVEGEYEGGKFDNTVTGKKENGKITEVILESKSEGESYFTRYEFADSEPVVIPEYTIPKSYDNLPHVDSPYKTYGEIIETFGEDEYLNYGFYNDVLVVIEEKDGRYYQFSTMISQELKDQYDELDFMDEEYEEHVYELIGDLEIEDCVDFTDEVLSQDEIAAYIGKEVQSMVDQGFDVSGYSFWDEYNFIYATKDSLTYEVAVELPEGFDPEREYDYEELGALVIKEVRFQSVEPVVLPMR